MVAKWLTNPHCGFALEESRNKLSDHVPRPLTCLIICQGSQNNDVRSPSQNKTNSYKLSSSIEEGERHGLVISSHFPSHSKISTCIFYKMHLFIKKRTFVTIVSFLKN